MTPDSERRRYKRFDMTARDCGLRFVRQVIGNEEHEKCELLDLSFAGMRFRARRAFQEGAVHHFLLALPLSIGISESLVEARICWTRAVEPDRHIQGAAFLESSTGWLGPEE
jgi:hypothetical protein